MENLTRLTDTVPTAVVAKRTINKTSLFFSTWISLFIAFVLLYASNSYCHTYVIFLRPRRQNQKKAKAALDDAPTRLKDVALVVAVKSKGNKEASLFILTQIFLFPVSLLLSCITHLTHVAIRMLFFVPGHGANFKKFQGCTG
jgi:hypothetical protein